VARRHVTEYAIRTSTATTGSTLEAEVFGGRHDHAWSFANSRSWRGVACASPLGNPLAHLYESEPAFRKHVLGRLGDGSLRREEFVAWLALPRRPLPEVRDTPGFRNSADAAHALVVESGTAAENHHHFWDWWDRGR
jgi:hypothetical protein